MEPNIRSHVKSGILAKTEVIIVSAEACDLGLEKMPLPNVIPSALLADGAATHRVTAANG